MKRKEFVSVIVAVLFVLAAALSTGLAQEKAADMGMQKIKVKGKIGYAESLGGYYVMGENPPSEIFIVNPDKKILEKLKKSGKTVTIEGRLTISADHLMIEKINGKKYTAIPSK
jgi:hypothetical protein